VPNFTDIQAILFNFVNQETYPQRLDTGTCDDGKPCNVISQNCADESTCTPPLHDCSMPCDP
jgi:hypothetical protein